jgi:hypothetical protein
MALPQAGQVFWTQHKTASLKIPRILIGLFTLVFNGGNISLSF